MSINSVVMSGNLTKDNEVRYTDSGLAVISFSIAVKREMSKEDKTDFFNVKKFCKSDKAVDFLGANLLKGKKVVLTGSVQNNNYEKQDGTKVYSTEIVADSIEFMTNGDKQGNKPQQEKEGQIPSGFQALEDDECPFI